MSKFAHDHIVPDAQSQNSKKEQVAAMFDTIAIKYDKLNRLLSGGIDIYWRKKAISCLAKSQPKQVLDVATGTADVALMTYNMLKPNRIIGVDISAGMLALGVEKIKQKNLQDKIVLSQADSENLPFADNSFDAVTVAFGVRNFQHLDKGLSEIYRVLKPGGELVILEFSKPTNKVNAALFNLYMNVISVKLVGLLKGNTPAYKYLNDSVQAFPEGKMFLQVLQQVGFTACQQQKMTLGIASIYTGGK